MPTAPKTPTAIPQRQTPKRQETERAPHDDQALLQASNFAVIGSLAAQIQVRSEREHAAPSE
jgi:hypothetical protein